MGAADRTVQHLHLRAPSAQAAVRAVHRLEDALRCASLPDTGERLLLVRRLHLGRLPAGLSSQSLSLLIEQRVLAAGGSWVHGEQAAAEQSHTVYFASRLQAAQAAVRRRAGGRSLDAWHWRLALPGVLLAASDPAFLHSVVALLAREEIAPVSLPALVADTVAAGHAPWLNRHVSEETSAILLAIGGVQRQVLVVEREWAAAARQPLEPATRLETSRSMGFRYRGARAQGRSAEVDLQAPLWVHAVLRAANWVPTSAVVTVPGAAPASSTSAKAPASRRRVAVRVAPSTASAPPIASTPRSPAATSEERVRDNPPPAARQVRARSLVASDHAAGAADAMAPPTQVAFDDRAPTGVGGLLFLIPVLERLGFGEWQRQHAGRPLAGLVLRQMLQRMRVPADDAAWALVASLPMPPPRSSTRWEAPALWRDEGIDIAHDPASSVQADEMARRWRLACSRYLRRVERIGIGLARLCLRPARVRWRATHIDVRFSLAAADLRVRRAGLDVDPGWVDWLQRVVRFEYTTEGTP